MVSTVNNHVVYGVTSPQYCSAAPYHPHEPYPELQFREVSEESNAPYALLRELLRDLGYDSARFGTPQWNPLRQLIKPGDTVVLKPNFVLSRNDSGQGLFACVTHPSILRALIDYAFLALDGSGRIVIADAPQMDCDWDELMAAQRLDSIQDFYQRKFKFLIETYDLRNFALINYREAAYSSNRKSLRGDPAGSVIINLGRQSHFYGLANENFYGADYDRQVTIQHHQGETQEYSVSKTVLSADVVISVPKMKVHKKVGVTLNLKGLVGINTDKNYLVHYTLGTPNNGGDQLPHGRPRFDRLAIGVQRKLYDIAMARQTRIGDAIYRTAATVYKRTIKPWRSVSDSTKIIDAGNWHGNDSCWRMTADLAKIIFFADKNGTLHSEPQRRLFCVVDGIIGGENVGPLEPDAKAAGCMVAGENPLAVDLVTTRLMGFDVRRIKQFEIIGSANWDFGVAKIGDVRIKAQGSGAGVDFFDPARRDRMIGFRAHPGWVGHIEV